MKTTGAEQRGGSLHGGGGLPARLVCTLDSFCMRQRCYAEKCPAVLFLCRYHRLASQETCGVDFRATDTLNVEPCSNCLSKATHETAALDFLLDHAMVNLDFLLDHVILHQMQHHRMQQLPQCEILLSLITSCSIASHQNTEPRGNFLVLIHALNRTAIG